MKTPVIISLGGSLIVPNGGIDTAFLKRFKTIILKRVAKGGRFVIICGGGATARHYQKAARMLGGLTREDVDWIGIHATRLNGHLLRTVFQRHAHPTVIKNPNAPPRFREPLLIAAGWKPGWSTDYDAVLLASALGATASTAPIRRSIRTPGRSSASIGKHSARSSATAGTPAPTFRSIRWRRSWPSASA